jgi:hypothetical protein
VSAQEELARNKAMLDDVSNSLDIEHESPTRRLSGLQRLIALWPWAWLALVVVASVGWAIGLGWAAVALVGWLIG